MPILKALPQGRAVFYVCLFSNLIYLCNHEFFLDMVYFI